MKAILSAIIMLYCLNAQAQIRYTHDIDTAVTRLDTIQGQIVYIQDGEVRVGSGIQIKTVFTDYANWYDWGDFDIALPVKYELSTLKSKQHGHNIQIYRSEGGTPIKTKYVIHFIPD